MVKPPRLPRLCLGAYSSLRQIAKIDIPKPGEYYTEMMWMRPSADSLIVSDWTQRGREFLQSTT